MTTALKRVQAHQRYCLPDGSEVPGVTSVLGVLAKPALVAWANRLGLEGVDVNKYVDKLANIGTLAHYLIECHITNTEPDLEPFSQEEITMAQRCMASFQAWFIENQPKFIVSELPLVSERWRYGGTCDGIARIGSKLVLVDFKTSKALYDEHTVQIAAYVQLAREDGYRVTEARIVRIGRTPDEGFEERIWPVKDLKPYWEIFRHALAIYEIRRRVK